MIGWAFALAWLMDVAGLPEPEALVRVKGAIDCPSAHNIEQEATALGAHIAPDLQFVVVAIESHEMRISFVASADHQHVDERVLPLPQDCQSRASTAAAAIASWLGQRQDQPLHLLDVPDAIAVEKTMPPPQKVAQVPKANSWAAMVGVMIASGDGWSPGLRLGVNRTKRVLGLGWALDMSVSLPYQTKLQGGVSHWVRDTITFGPQVGFDVGPVHLSAELAAAGILLWAWGRGYPSNHSDGAVVPGGSAGVHLVWNSLPHWWINARAVYAASSSVHAWSGSDMGSHSLDQLDVQFALGASFDGR